MIEEAARRRGSQSVIEGARGDEDVEIEIEAFRRALLLNIKQKQRGRKYNSVLRKRVDKEASLIAIQQTNETNAAASDKPDRSPADHRRSEMRPSQLAKQILKQTKDRYRRMNANLSVQSVGCNPQRTQIEDIMQERLEVSIGVMDRVNDMEFAKKNKSSSVVLDVNASFDKLFPCISMQKLDKNLPIGKYEEYLYAMNDHTKRMNQYIDSKIQIENRRQSVANAESAMNTQTTISQLLSQPNLN